MYLPQAKERGTNTAKNDLEKKPAGLMAFVTQLRRWWNKRATLEQRRKAKRRLHLLESLNVGPKQRVILMRCGRQRFLLGVGSDGIQTMVPLAERPGLRLTPDAKEKELQWS